MEHKGLIIGCVVVAVGVAAAAVGAVACEKIKKDPRNEKKTVGSILRHKYYEPDHDMWA
jgi:F0F1-type ATP synthase membrane subunit c/vacuolar-type H+-ATPase subunit K